jgi:hypothetical protein
VSRSPSVKARIIGESSDHISLHRSYFLTVGVRMNLDSVPRTMAEPRWSALHSALSHIFGQIGHLASSSDKRTPRSRKCSRIQATAAGAVGRCPQSAPHAAQSRSNPRCLRQCMAMRWPRIERTRNRSRCFWSPVDVLLARIEDHGSVHRARAGSPQAGEHASWPRA